MGWIHEVSYDWTICIWISWPGLFACGLMRWGDSAVTWTSRNGLFLLQSRTPFFSTEIIGLQLRKAASLWIVGRLPTLPNVRSCEISILQNVKDKTMPPKIQLHAILSLSIWPQRPDRQCEARVYHIPNPFLLQLSPNQTFRYGRRRIHERYRYIYIFSLQ